MRQLLRKNIFFIFWVIVLTGLVAVIFDFRVLDLLFKPLLMPALMTAILLKSINKRGRLKVLTALAFSWLGDMLLLFEPSGQFFFMAGLASFLIAHLLYIAYFNQVKQFGPSLLNQYPYLVIAILLYSSTLLFILFPGLGDMKLPVILYAVVISTMLIFSLRIPFKTGRRILTYFVSGAIFFVLSDSLLAINKFYKPFIFASLLIRITYCVAQYQIVKGFIKKRY